MAFEADAVAGAVLEELLKAGFADLVEAFFVDFFGNGSFFELSGYPQSTQNRVTALTAHRALLPVLLGHGIDHIICR